MKTLKDEKTKALNERDAAIDQRNEAYGQRDAAQRALADLQQSSDQQIRTLMSERN